MTLRDDHDVTKATGIKAGEVLAGKYEVRRVIGSGGMAVVVEARHVVLGERVALKCLRPMFVDGGEMSTRFMREAQAMAKIRGENIARVSDVGTLENGAPYLVMEYLEGRDLGKMIDDGPLPIGGAVDLILQAAEALAEAHAQGIVHRDIKPSNLFVTRRPDGTPLVKVMDFGIAKVMSENEDQAKITATGTIMGSPAYMAPEQIRTARAATPRSDVWSLGVVLFEALTGRAPYTGDSMTSLIMAIITDPVPRLEERRPDVPPGLQQVIEGCLAKVPEERYQSVYELAVALAPFAPETARGSVRRIQSILNAPEVDKTFVTPGLRTPRLGTATEITVASDSRPAKRPVVPYVVGGLGVAMLGAALALLVVRNDPPPSPAPASASPATPSSAPAAASSSAAAPASSQPEAHAPPPASSDAPAAPPVATNARPKVGPPAPPTTRPPKPDKDPNFGKATDTRK